jgi:hypothetical protein
MLLSYSVIYAFNMTLGKHMFSMTESIFRPVPTFVTMDVARTTLLGLVEMAPPPKCTSFLSFLSPYELHHSTIVTNVINNHPLRAQVRIAVFGDQLAIAW